MDETNTPATTPAETVTADAQQSTETQKPTEPDMSAIVARESRKAVEKLLRDAGITPDDKPEMKLKEYKSWLDGQKSELETAQSSLSDLTRQRDEATAKMATMERTLLAVEKGIPGDKAAKYIRLAEAYLDGDDFGKALDAALVDFPIEKRGGAPAGANPGGTGATTENYGATVAKRKLEQQKKARDALNNL